MHIRMHQQPASYPSNAADHPATHPSLNTTHTIKQKQAHLLGAAPAGDPDEQADVALRAPRRETEARGGVLLVRGAHRRRTLGRLRGRDGTCARHVIGSVSTTRGRSLAMAARRPAQKLRKNVKLTWLVEGGLVPGRDVEGLRQIYNVPCSEAAA